MTHTDFAHIDYVADHKGAQVPRPVADLGDLRTLAQRRAKAHARRVSHRMAGSPARQRKRKRAIGVALTYAYCDELHRVTREHPEWTYMTEIPERVRDAAAQRAESEVRKMLLVRS